MRPPVAFAAILLAGCASATRTPRTAPLVDYHQHLVSPAFAPLVKLPVRDGAELVRRLDEAGVDRAVVLSVGYTFADERKGFSNPDQLTRRENDWTAVQVRQNAPRLIGFCSANPLRPAALAEFQRCLRLPGMVGIKLHLGNSGVSLRNPDHIEILQQVFALAERLRVPVLVHMRARGGENYGGEDAAIFLGQVLPRAPSIDVIVAHMGGGGSYPDQVDAVMAAFGEAFRRQDRQTRRLYFDVSGVVTEGATPADGALVAKRIREVGAEHILYGSDTSPPGGTIRSGWEIFRSKVPLTSEEFQTIMSHRLQFAR